jgi:hypothetical protein
MGSRCDPETSPLSGCATRGSLSVAFNSRTTFQEKGLDSKIRDDFVSLVVLQKVGS